MKDPARWQFDEDHPIAAGRHALKLLGRGERYETYLAWDEQLFSLVVIKVLRPDRLDDDHARRGLAAEAHALQVTRHPVIVRSFDAVLDGPRPHLVLEHLDGPPLSSLLRRYGPLPLPQLLPLAVQVCSALHYLRGRGLVHLDLKPRNIIMGAPPRVIDLSVARTVEEAAQLSHRVGTDAYLSPEQCDPLGRGPVGPPADVWGLGVTLHQAMTASLPYPRPDPDARALHERFPQLAGAEPVLPAADLPWQLVDAISSCLRPEPSERPTPQELAGVLEPAIAALPRRPVLSRLRPRLTRR